MENIDVTHLDAVREKRKNPQKYIKPKTYCLFKEPMAVQW